MVLFRTGRHPVPEDTQAWDRAVDRFGRAVSRYHEKVAMIPDRRLRTELGHIGEQLDTSMADVVAATARVEVRTGRHENALRAVARAATQTQHAVEAALTAADAHRHQRFDDVTRCLDSTRTLVKSVRELADVCRG
jgi:hypothetical protein